MKLSLMLVLFIAVVWLFAVGLGLPLTAQALDRANSFEPRPVVTAMIARVQSGQVYTYDAQLSGEVPALIGGVPYTLTTRHTNSGQPIQQATQFVYEHLQRQGLAASYHNWNNCSTSGRNVVGVLTGTLTPGEIVLITAHLDDMPSTGRAPGADDNASGSVGVMVAAEIMSPYRFERTVRFIFFTGEEQGLCGSEVYADAVSAAGDNIVAVYNMDMIAYDSTGGPTLRLHTRTTSNPGYPGDLAIAGVFTNVVNAYGMSGALTPIIDPDGISASDHYPFWQSGYPALLAIEDDVDDFNAFYHTINDNLSHINLTYFTNFVKASVGTAAHLARPLNAVLQGTVSDLNTTLPISGVQIVAAAGITRTGSAVTNSNGQYDLLLLDGSYAITATAYGYAPFSVTNVQVQAGFTTTQHLTLTAVKFYAVGGQISDVLTQQPLSATISIDGYPYGSIVTDQSGAYQAALASDVTHTLHVNANLPGYIQADRTIGRLTDNRMEDFALTPDLMACTAPGYTFAGVAESFSASITPTGWIVNNAVGAQGWAFNNPHARANNTGGAGNFAIADSDHYGPGINMNTELRSPVLNLSALSSVTLTFKTDLNYYEFGDSEVAEVDVSLNNAGTWTNVWQQTSDVPGPQQVTLDLSTLTAGKAEVQLRFHYYNAVFDGWWQIDDVRLGQCLVPEIQHYSLYLPLINK